MVNLKNILSIGNTFYMGNKEKVLKLFGLKIKLKFFNPSYYLEYLNLFKFLHHNVKPNTAYVIEFNSGHFETILGYYKYLKDLGFNVEILMNKRGFAGFNSKVKENIKIWRFGVEFLVKIFDKYFFNKESYLVFNSKRVYDNLVEGTDLSEIIKYPKEKSIFVQHHIDKVFETPEDKQIILANPAKDDRLENIVVNPHYFGDVKITDKNDITNFIMVGTLDEKRRNGNLIISATKTLVENGFENFKITVVGNGNLDNIEEKYSKFIDIKGGIDYKEMYEEMEKSDFFLPLLDPDVKAQDRYKKAGTSGSFQLIYGFLKPCIIHKTFADIYNFTEKDSLIYEENQQLANSMQKAIEMTKEEYKNYQNNLKNAVENLEQTSLENFKNLL